MGFSAGLSHANKGLGMFAKIEEIERRYNEFEIQLASPEIMHDPNVYRKVAKEHRLLMPIVTTYRKYQSIQDEIAGNKSLLSDSDPEMRKLAKEEIAALQSELNQLEQELKILLLPKDPNDEKNILLEIRAGTGGDEASLFAADLFRMYGRYAELAGWKTEILSENITGMYSATMRRRPGLCQRPRHVGHRRASRRPYNCETN